MASAKTVRNLGRDIIDAVEAVVDRVAVAEKQAKGANRQANRLGTTVSGGRGEGPQHSDPTVEEAFRVIDTIDRAASEFATIKHALYHLTNHELAEWAPARQPDNGIRRCGEDDCARPHHTRGLCDMHRRRLERAEARQKAIDRAKQDDQASG